jgi:hypothetical protein
MIEMPIMAFYFAVMVLSQGWPVMIGPYSEWAECASVREYLDRRGFETGSCELMPIGQEAKRLEVIDLP